MIKISSALLLTFLISLPLKADSKWDKKKALIGASIAFAASACFVGIWWLCKKKEPSRYQCDFCKQYMQGFSLRKLHCGHSFCHSCMDEIGDTILRPEYEGRTYCGVCGEQIEASEIWAFLSDDLQDLITMAYFI